MSTPSFPPEILLQIGKHADNKSLATALRASNLTYDVFLECLYTSPSSRASVTLARPQEVRKAPGPHPATFVVHLRLKSDYVSFLRRYEDRETLENRFQAVLKNIQKHGRPNRLKSLGIERVNMGPWQVPELPSHVALKSLFFSSLDHPGGGTLSGVQNLFQRSLTSVEIVSNVSSIIVECFKSLQGLRLTHLRIDILAKSPEVGHPEPELQALFDSLAYLFPLKKMEYRGDNSSVNFSRFLLRHPHLEELKYFDKFPDHSFLSNTNILGNLVRFTGCLQDAVLICRRKDISLSQLSVTETTSSNGTDRQDLFSLCANFQTLRQLRIAKSDFQSSLLTYNEIRSLFSGCLNLTHLEVSLYSRDTDKELFLKTAINSFSNLEHLRIEVDFEWDEPSFATAIENIISQGFEHRTVKFAVTNDFSASYDEYTATFRNE